MLSFFLCGYGLDMLIFTLVVPRLCRYVNDTSAYRVAIAYSLISTSKNAGIEPRIWMEDILTKIPDHRSDGIDLFELLPRQWLNSDLLFTNLN